MRFLSPPEEEDLVEGTRIGRFVVLRDVDGRRHAVAAGAVLAMADAEDGDTLLHVPGGRALQVPHPLTTVLRWFEVR
jgi:hypothetical protein